MKHIVSDILDREMNRKEFIQNVGVGAMMIFGGGMIVKAFGLDKNTAFGRNTASGYGSSAYGGSPRNRS